MKNAHLYIKGMHCRACEVFIEETLNEHALVNAAKIDPSDASINIQFNADQDDLTPFVQELNRLFEDQKYKFYERKVKSDFAWGDFILALPIAILFVLGFVLLQKSGLLERVSFDNMSVLTALAIGIVASLSSCLAVVGGLVLSLSSTFAKKGHAVNSQIHFHIGRLIGFFVLGGLIGLLGQFIRISQGVNIALGLFIAIVMLILGLNLIEFAQFFRRLLPQTPKAIAFKLDQMADKQKPIFPFMIGVLTFFLPCGFTQAMQIYTLSTGSFVSGALTMLFFALGTLPVLALLSFGAFNFAEKQYAGIFFKTAGLIIVFLAIFNLYNILRLAGLI